ncbi:MAG TPA: shikimate dehydrogenase [Candidatus Dormibacteraeota bacterium]|nr:shikimate dehydrogenase [Candidatus Dormibacteraeota bacterium]
MNKSISPFGAGLRRICAVIAARTFAEMKHQVPLAQRAAKTIELRLDWLESDTQRSLGLRWLKKSRPKGVTFIATCRRKVAGGNFRGSVNAELLWLNRAREAGCSWCDLEIETLREIPGQVLRPFALPSRVLLSLHDFSRTPADLNQTNLASHLTGEIHALKIAAMANSIDDSLRLLRIARHAAHMVAVPMGDIGLPARILALRENSALAYAPVAESTAPGQVSFSDMVNLYRAHKITPRTKIFGVIGDPIAHSLSPLMHNSGYVARNLDAVYLPFLVKNLREFLKTVPEFNLRGFSVTLPHKQSILEHLAECDPLAQRIGAVNTVTVRPDGTLYGCNTDYVGVLRALERKLRIRGSRVLIFGAGGSARAAAFALAQAGAHVFICARREKASRELANAVGGQNIPRRALRTESFDAILNATPIGMYPHANISPLAASELHCRIVMDLIYRPESTRLLKIAAQKGISTVSGVDMFLAQGIAQWELWTHKPAPEPAMRKAVITCLRVEASRNNPARPLHAKTSLTKTSRRKTAKTR